VDKLDYRLLAHWVKSMMANGLAPNTVHSVHGLISAAVNTAEMLGPHRNPSPDPILTAFSLLSDVRLGCTPTGRGRQEAAGGGQVLQSAGAA
jgi:hypothetical protein